MSLVLKFFFNAMLHGAIMTDRVDEAYAERNAWQTHATIARQEAETVVKEWKAVIQVAEARIRTLEAALREALDEYEYACTYEHFLGSFVKKPGDKGVLARLRAVLSGETPA